MTNLRRRGYFIIKLCTPDWKAGTDPGIPCAETGQRHYHGDSLQQWLTGYVITHFVRLLTSMSADIDRQRRHCLYTPTAAPRGSGTPQGEVCYYLFLCETDANCRRRSRTTPTPRPAGTTTRQCRCATAPSSTSCTRRRRSKWRKTRLP